MLRLFFRLKSFVCRSKWHCVQGCQPLVFGVAVEGEVSIAICSVAPSAAAALAAEVVGGVDGAGVSGARLQPSQTHSLNFCLLCMAVSGRGVMRHTEQGG